MSSSDTKGVPPLAVSNEDDDDDTGISNRKVVQGASTARPRTSSRLSSSSHYLREERSSLNSLGRLVANLSLYGTSKVNGRAVARRLESTIRATNNPFAQLSHTLLEIEAGISSLQSSQKGGTPYSRDLEGNEQQQQELQWLGHRIAFCMLMNGPFFQTGDLQRLWEAFRPVAGRNLYFDPFHGHYLAHLASGLYEQHYDWSMESHHAKLNYPFAALKQNVFYVPNDDTDMQASLPESQRGRWSVAVVGLAGHGKTALCGRMVQALGQTSLWERGRVQAAARRGGIPSACSDAERPAIDAVWMMDRSAKERQEKTTLQTKDFPLWHKSTGSFTLYDTPPTNREFADRQQRRLPRQMCQRKSTLEVLTFADPKVVVVCVAVDKIFTQEQLLGLLWQVAVSARPRQIVFAVTRMDLVGWEEAPFHRVADCIISALVDQSVPYTIIPTSAAAPACGIISKVRTGHWERQPATPPSILNIIAQMSSELSFDNNIPEKTDECGFLGILGRFRRGRGYNSCLLESVYMIRGSICSGQKLDLASRWGSFRVNKIQWYHRSCFMAYAGQRVGLELEFIPSKDWVGIIDFPRRKPWRHKYQPLFLKSDEEYSLKGKLKLRVLCPVNPDHESSGHALTYPKSIYLAPSKLQNIGTVEVDLYEQKVFYAGQRVVVYQSNRLIGFGFVSKDTRGHTVGPEDLNELEHWLSRDLPALPTQSNGATIVHEMQHTPPPPQIPKPAPVGTRDISWFSTLSLEHSEKRDSHTLSSCHKGVSKSIKSGPALSIGEALQQTDKAIKSLLRLREELEKVHVLTGPQSNLFSKSSAKSQTCYMCMKPCYDSPDPRLLPICRSCVTLNQVKREAHIGLDLIDSSYSFVVTGARIKIGYATVHRLISQGAKSLVLTTRFPYTLARKLINDPSLDLSSGKVIIHIYGCDFRCVSAVMALGQHLARYYPKIYALINNAAQTVRRPAAFYKHLVDKELELAQCPGSHHQFVRVVGKDPFDISKPAAATAVPSEATQQQPQQTQIVTKSITCFQDCEQYQACASALMTQCRVTEEDNSVLMVTEDGEREGGGDMFPASTEGSYDPNTGEILGDIRPQTSWTKSLLPSASSSTVVNHHEDHAADTVNPIECLEVLLVNTLAPFILLKYLLGPLQGASGNVINVSSREGVFARVKFSDHPHTNMGKAGLNMLTRTSAYELKRINVMICSVDPGWVTSPTRRHVPPLTVEDAAARILDPLAQRIGRDHGTGDQDEPTMESRSSTKKKKGHTPPKLLQSGVFWRNYKIEPFV
jgi:NAD(P)-dependent dehydrogenase (short-subunit alcohol dehydrogenase family)/translation elongation factor EF-1alpha